MPIRHYLNTTRTPAQVVLLGGFVVAAIILIFLAFKPGRYLYNEQIGDARILFSADRAWVQAADECFLISWSVENIQAVYLNGQGVIGEGDAESCDPLGVNVLRVVLKDGSKHNYSLELRQYPLTSTQGFVYLGIAGGLLVTAVGLSFRFPHVPVKRRAKPTRLYLALCAGIILLGIILRVEQFLINRPIWADEATLSLNILGRPYTELLQPLNYDQAAPVGFLLLERLAVDLFGESEYALRLLPLFASCAALLVLFPVARRVLGLRATPIALLLMATSEMQLYYAAEVKPYSLDVLIALILCLLYLHIESRKPTIRNVIFWSVVGAASLWFSYTALFVLIAVGLIVLYRIWSTPQKDAVPLLLMLVVWGASFALNYFVALTGVSGNEFLRDFWVSGFAPYPASEFFAWLSERFYGALANVSALRIEPAVVILYVLGLGALYRKHKAHFLLAVVPVSIALLAAISRIYPFQERLILFLSPFMILAISYGIAAILWLDQVHVVARFAAGAVLLLSLFPLQYIPSREPDFRLVLQQIDAKSLPADTIYLFGGTSATYIYYAHLYGVDWQREVDASLERLQDGQYAFATDERVWLFRRGTAEIQAWDATQAYFDEYGTLEDQFVSEGGSAYLYRME